jgi:hypothetical protein
MLWRTSLVLAIRCILWIGDQSARGDEFDRIDGEVLRSCLRTSGTRTHAALGFRELEALPSVLRDSRSALFLIKTDQGNLARLLVSPGFRKRPSPDNPPGPGLRGSHVPLLFVERFEVFDGANPSSRLVRGKDLMLFGGFQVDLDTGQVVPEGLGGDLLFTARGQDEGVVQGVGRVRLATLERPPVLPPPAQGTPSGGRTVRPADVAGRFRLLANGQWSGRLDLAVDGSGGISGRFLSDASGSAFPVIGKLDPASSRKVQFSIQFPRTKQDYQGILWTEGKHVITGRMSMLDQDFGFLAIRDGYRLEVEALSSPSALLGAGKPSGAWLRVRVEPEPDRYTLDNQPHSTRELAEALERAGRSGTGTGVLVLAAESVPYKRIRQALEVIQAAGLSTVRLAPAPKDP